MIRTALRTALVATLVLTLMPVAAQMLSVSAATDQASYREGQACKIAVQSTADARIYVMHRGSDNDWNLVFPNHFSTDNKVKAGQVKVAPGSFNLTVEGLAGERHDFRVFAVAAGAADPLRSIREAASSNDPFPTVEPAAIASALKNVLGSDRSGQWASTSVSYKVSE